MTVEEINVLNDKAKSKKDGVYSHRGIDYVVLNNKFVAFSTKFGECFQRYGRFNVSIGNVGFRNGRRALIDWMKRNK